MRYQPKVLMMRICLRYEPVGLAPIGINSPVCKEQAPPLASAHHAGDDVEQKSGRVFGIAEFAGRQENLPSDVK